MSKGPFISVAVVQNVKSLDNMKNYARFELKISQVGPYFKLVGRIYWFNYSIKKIEYIGITD